MCQCSTYKMDFRARTLLLLQYVTVNRPAFAVHLYRPGEYDGTTQRLSETFIIARPQPEYASCPVYTCLNIQTRPVAFRKRIEVTSSTYLTENV